MFGVIIIILSYDCMGTVVSGSVLKRNSENEQNQWSYGISDIPAVGWIYDQMYPSSNSSESNSHIVPLPNEIVENQNHDAFIDTFDYGYGEFFENPTSAKRVGDILEIIEKSDDEEKKHYESFLTNLEDTISNNPARYIKVFLKNIWRTVDLGIFNSGERRRDAEKTRGLLQRIRDLLFEIFSAIYHFFVDRIEAGKRGVHKGSAEYERRKEGDNREYTEEEALEKLKDMEKHYGSIEKETMIKDITSLCMQPLYKESTYEKIITFLNKMKDDGYEKAKLEKAFEYVVRYFATNILPEKYKKNFSRDHEID